MQRNEARAIRAAFGSVIAVRWQLIANNVAEAVELPSPEVRELPPLPPSEAGRLITLFEKTDLLNVVVFAIRFAAPIATAFPHRTPPFSRARRIGLCTYS